MSFDRPVVTNENKSEASSNKRRLIKSIFLQTLRTHFKVKKTKVKKLTEVLDYICGISHLTLLYSCLQWNIFLFLNSSPTLIGTFKWRFFKQYNALLCNIDTYSGAQKLLVSQFKFVYLKR